MARLPLLWNDPNGAADQNNWGSILKTFLQVAHNADGTVIPTSINLTLNGVVYGGAGTGLQVTAQGPTNSVLTANAGAPIFTASPILTALTTTGALTVGNALTVTAGPLLYAIGGLTVASAFGGAAQGGYMLTIGGTWTPTNAGQAAGLLVTTGINAAANTNAAHFFVSSPGGITKAASGTHPTFATAWVDNLIVNAAAGALTNAYSFVVGGTATGGSPTNRGTSWFVGSGANRFDGDGTFVEIILNRTAAGNAPQIQFSRNLTPQAYIGLSSGNDLTFLDLNAVERMRLTASTGGGLQVGTNPGDPGAGKINISGAQGYQISGTSITTLALKTGSGGGDYTTTSATYVDVDAANLAYTVTIPSGFKLLVNVACGVKHSTLAATVGLSLLDGSTIVEEIIEAAVAGDREHMGLTWAITGDGASHTVKLQWKTSAATATMSNSSSTLKPQMTFLMVPSA